MRKVCAPAFIFIFWAVGAFVLRCHNLRDVLVEGRIYFIDADCYSRMTRVRMIQEHPGTIVRHQVFENYPQGTDSHATSLFDYAILAVRQGAKLTLKALDPHGTSVLEGQLNDVAGALVSPLLGGLGAGFIALFARQLGLGMAAGWTAPLLWTVSPVLVHGTILGRPDHQSLQMVLVAVALAAELRLAGEAGPNRRWWGVASGAAWALAMWVSLYEPAILFVAAMALWLVFRPRALIERERWAGWGTFVAILGVALLVEGWPVELPEAAMRPYLSGWSGTIGELQGLSLLSPTLYRWLGAACVAAPVLLFLAYRKDRRALPVGILLAVSVGLTCWQIRWGYFCALIFALTLPWQMSVLRRWWVIGIFQLASFWPLLGEWEARLFPEPEQRASAHRELRLLRETAESLRGPERAPFLAPWWISPALAYWSEQPGIAGSSHESISGIVDSARFYLAGSPEAAAGILRRRGVARVVSDDADRIIDKCTPILGQAPPANCMAARLVNVPRGPAPYLLPVYANDYFRVYAVDEARLPR